MDLEQVKAQLKSADMYERLDAVKALKNYDKDIAIPLLLESKKDEQFLVRSFVVRELGNKKTAESFAALLEILRFDRDTNVKAEACNSLSLFGEISIPHLQQTFHQDDSWLVRLSILGVLTEFNCPDELLDISITGIKGEDFSVRENSLSSLASLVNTSKEEEALTILLAMANDPSWRIRLRVAQSLTKFPQDSAKQVLNQLQKDEDHRVVAAALEKEIPMDY